MSQQQLRWLLVTRFIDREGPEIKLVALHKHFYQRRAAKVPLNQGFGKRIFYVFLQRAPERARSIGSIATHVSR